MLARTSPPRCRPLITKGVLGAGIFGLGDAIVQYYEHVSSLQVPTPITTTPTTAPTPTGAVDVNRTTPVDNIHAAGHADTAQDGLVGEHEAEVAGSGTGGTAAAPPFSIDITRTAAAAGWRALIFTPPAHFFYTFIDQVVKLPTTGSLRRTRFWFAVCFIDGLVWLPPVFASYFATSTLIRGGTLDDAYEKVKSSIVPALQFSLCFWPPMHLLTFFVIPPAQRLLFVNVASIAIAFSLSFIDNIGPAALSDVDIPTPPLMLVESTATDSAVIWEKYGSKDLQRRGICRRSVDPQVASTASRASC